MSINSIDLKGVLLLAIVALFVRDIQAQDKASSNIVGAMETGTIEKINDVHETLSSGSLPIDTLRNYSPADGRFRWAVDLDSLNQGWVHGTNEFEDLAKATRMTLPAGATSATLLEVLVHFVHLDPAVTTETYDLEIREVDALGAPGTLISSQTYNMADIDADDDLNTAAVPTVHAISPGVSLPQQFFVVLNFGSYGEAGWDDVAILATDNLGRFVAEDWEQFDSGTWSTMSESWFNDPQSNGWHMWIDAVVDVVQEADVTPPVIQLPSANARVPAGQALTVSADVTDAGLGVQNVFLSFIEGGRADNSIERREMSLVSGSTYETTIPAGFINGRGLEYQVAATDLADNTSFSDVEELIVRLENGLDQALSVSGTDADNYRLFSVPIILDDNAVRSVIEDDLGTYNPENWRFFELQPNQNYVEFPNVGRLIPGRSFWIATSQSGQSINTGAGETATTEFLGEIPLSAGWTFIGAPFNFPIQREQLFLESGGTTLDIREFNGSWGAISGPLMPFRGYAVASVAADRMFVEPFIVPSGKREAGSPAKNGSSAPIRKNDVSFVATSTGDYEWAVSIVASAGAVVDNDNVLAVSENASGEWDQLDRPEPPVIGNYISLYFPHRDWDVPFSQFNADVRPSFDASQKWAFEVTTNLNEPIELSFDGIESIPAEFDIQLVDRKLHHVQDLRESPVYTIMGGEEDLKERFSVIVGTSSAVSEDLDDLIALPETLSLRGYPNPFQSHMTLEFGLPEATDVSIEVYDLLGKRVATLIQRESRTEGTHAVQWDGADSFGRPLANGIYMMALQTGESRATQKVVLLR